MSQPLNQYVICTCLDESFRIAGLTLDEFIPIVFLLLMGFLTRGLGIAIIAALFWVIGLRSLKRGKGSAVLLLMLYRHTSPEVGGILFPSFPPSTQKYWW